MVLEKPFIFVGGKGGVGKSTIAAALSYQFAMDKKETLLVSTDPAHNLGDIFEKKVGNGITKVGDYLSVIEIDSLLETEKYIKKVKQNLKGLVKTDLINEVNRQIDLTSSSPGAEEAALFERIVSILLENKEQYDRIIIDTAPTGHTVRLLSLPELMGVWVEGMLNKRLRTNNLYSELLGDGEKSEDPIYEVLMKRKQRFSEVREMITNQNETAFIFVINPEQLSILETDKAIKTLERHQIPVKEVIVNKVLPHTSQDTFLRHRKKIETKYIEEIKGNFSRKKLLYIPYLPEDIIGFRGLQKICHYL